MKKSIFIACLLIISHLAVYHVTKITTENETVSEYKRNLLDLLFMINDPEFQDSTGEYKKEVFDKMSLYGWEITESEKGYSFIFNHQSEWQVAKDDMKTIKRIDSE